MEQGRARFIQVFEIIELRDEGGFHIIFVLVQAFHLQLLAVRHDGFDDAVEGNTQDIFRHDREVEAPLCVGGLREVFSPDDGQHKEETDGGDNPLVGAEAQSSAMVRKMYASSSGSLMAARKRTIDSAPTKPSDKARMISRS